ncbi:MAG: preprotein translocase subunit YajC [Lachnospiraceae bacterium]|jgi:preprotein translocase subunit YajC|nr:preprotein translocase subunit YajC [Lachnospiraceae bacterium]MBP5565577.1 preprotein translocase subunit YajC [Lachnospiraceae bacterium]MBQ4275917.1 preprotein translocase subunit YajC [Lachnospiraceae bacterium]
MYNLLLEATNAATSTNATQGGGFLSGLGIWGTVGYIVIFGVFIYFVIIRPQKKEQKKMSAMLASMAVGDSVVTTSGFYGVIIDITDEDVIVEFGSNKNCRIPMKKSAIAQIEKAE